jgi:fimbrial chaperone protein
MKIINKMPADIGRALSTLCLMLACCFSLVAVTAAQAFTLTPITMDFTPGGRGANQAFQVENPSNQTVAIQISMLTREMDLDGKEHNALSEDDFIVYPAQVLLKPKQVQTVRVKWVGPAKLEKELSYRILAEELPINLSKEQPTSNNLGAYIKVIVRYLGSIYIVPPGAKADITLDSTAAETQKNGMRKLVFVFHNRGTAHVLLSELKLTLQSDGKTVELSGEDLKGVAGENLLAGNKRRFVVPWPTALPGGPVKASFGFDGRH